MRTEFVPCLAVHSAVLRNNTAIIMIIWMLPDFFREKVRIFHENYEDFCLKFSGTPYKIANQIFQFGRKEFTNF